MQDCSVPGAPCCPLGRGPTAAPGQPGWGVGAKCLSEVQAQLGLGHPLTNWRVEEQPQLAMRVQSASVLGWSRKADPGWKIREPPACVLLPMGQPGFVGAAGTDGRARPGEQFSSCHPALLLQHWAPLGCGGTRGKGGHFGAHCQASVSQAEWHPRAGLSRTDPDKTQRITEYSGLEGIHALHP